MPIVFQPLAALHSGTAAGALGRVRAAPDTAFDDIVTLNPTADPLGLDLLARFTTAPGGAAVDRQLRPDLVVIGVTVRVIGVIQAGEPRIMQARIGENDWLVTDDAGLTSSLSNGAPCIEQRSLGVVGPLLAWEPIPALRFAAGTWAAPPDSFNVTVTLAQRLRGAAGSALWGGFLDTAADPTGRTLLDTSLRSLSRRAGGLFATQGNVGSLGAPAFPPTTVQQDAVLVDCVFAGPSPFAAVWVDASDVGPTTTERTRIPVDIASNNVASYQRYPAAFFRRPTFARAVERPEPANPASIHTLDGAPAIYTTAVDVTASRWWFQVDGVGFHVLLQHGAPNYSGLRRPADIWNQVIVSALNREAPLDLFSLGGGTPLRGLLQRLEFMEYATFLDGYDSEGNPAYTLTPQTGAEAPGPR